MSVSERRLCRLLGQHRSTQRKAPRGADDEAALTEDIIALARQHGRYGYRRVTALLRNAGWHVNRKRVGQAPVDAQDRIRAPAAVFDRTAVHRRLQPSDRA